MQSLAKGKIHWLFTQTIEIKAFEKGQKEFTIIYLLIDLILYSIHCKLRASVALQGQTLMKKRSLRIQGRMQIFRKNVPEGFKSCFDSATA